MTFFRTFLNTNKHLLINMNNVTTITRSQKSIHIQHVNHEGFGSWILAWVNPKSTTLYYTTEEDAHREFERMEKSMTK